MSYKVYKVKVEGKEYQVEVEEFTDYPEQMAAGTRPVGSASQVSAPVASPVAQSAPAPVGGEVVKAPLQGTIIGLAVKIGDSVKAGDVLLKIEALKMENEVLSPKDGTIESVSVQDGQRVSSGDVLCSVR